MNIFGFYSITMKMLLFPLKFIYKVYFALYFGVSLIVFYPIFKICLRSKKGFPSAFKWMRIYAKLWLFFTGIYIKTKGKENIIKNQPFLICSNHSSFIDIPCLYVLFEDYFVFTGKQEIEKWPLFRIFYTSGMNILVDRNNKNNSMKAFKQMISVIDEGNPLVIFPEGTITKNAPNFSEFKTGAVSLAIQKQIPILPITFVTNWKRLQRSGLFIGKASPGISSIIIHPMIYTEGLTKKSVDELNNKLKEIIQKPFSIINI